MNREQAQFVLLAYRRGEPVPEDLDLGQALALAAEDPTLAEWLDRELETDIRIRQRVREVMPPAGLRDRILAESRSRIVQVPWWRHPGVLAAAAGLLAVVGSAGWWFTVRKPAGSPPNLAARPASRTLHEYRAEMVRLVSTASYRLDLNTDRLAEVREYLTSRGTSVEVTIPRTLERLDTYGCQVLDWDGETVTLICFRALEIQIAHLVIIDARALRDPPAGPDIALNTVGTWSTASWRDRDKVLMICSPAGSAELKRFLGG